MNAEESKKNKKANEELLATAKKRFKIAEEAEMEIRTLALEDLKFRAGEQWPQDVLNDRNNDNRPCLVINRMPQFIRQVTNDQRQNRPAIKIHPVDDKADIDTAKIYQGLYRHIEYNSAADVAYDTSFEGAAIKGFGYFRVITQYVHPMSFDQEIIIKQIEDDFSVYLDPNAKEPDGSDANWGFVFENISKEDFKAEYGESDMASMASMSDWSSIGDLVKEGWVEKSTVRVAEYFYKDFHKKKISLLSNGESILTDDLKSVGENLLPEGVTVVKERMANIPYIKWCKINGNEVLEETDWPGRWIPIIPVLGDKLVIEGKKILEGIVRHAKDPQRMYNYWASTETETIALAPRAPFIVAEGQIPDGKEWQWEQANKKSFAFLEYKPTSHAGKLVGPPQRNMVEPPVGGITNARMQASEDLKSTTGIYDAALGNKSNETSGVAINARNRQAQTSNFHLIDNLTRSIRHCGRIVTDLIPHIYDTARAARIIGEEGDEEVIRINEEFKHNGELKTYQLSKGKYDVVIDTGPNYATKREEASRMMLDLSKSAPQLMEVAPDLIVKNFDFPGATEIAERLKRTLPPGIAEDKEKGKDPIPEEVKAQMEEMGQMIEQLTGQLEQANEDVKTKSVEIQSKERIEMAKLQKDYAKLENDLKLAVMKQSGESARYIVEQQAAELDKEQKLINEKLIGGGSDQPTPTQVQPQNSTGGVAPGTL